MATQGIDLNVDLVKKATGDLYQAIENLRLSVKAVDDASDAARAGWKGSANAAFVTTSRDWSDEAARINKKLDDLTQETEKATQAILGMDEDDFIPGGGYTSL